MRKQGVKCPIVMLTAQDSDADTIYGLDAGANDYVSKAIQIPRSAGAFAQPIAHSMNSPKTPFSSLGHIPSSPPKRC